MSRIGKNRNFKTLVGVVMTLVMVLTLFAGIGAIWVNEDTGSAIAGVVDPATGKYNLPSPAPEKELGTAENPFIALEIVPSYDTASFGYLVDGQEPIDIYEMAKEDLRRKKEAAEGETVETYASRLAEFLNVGIGEDISTTEFQNIYTKDGFTIRVGEEELTLDQLAMNWRYQGSTAQYGTYTRISEGETGDYSIASTAGDAYDEVVGYKYILDTGAARIETPVDIRTLSTEQKKLIDDSGIAGLPTEGRINAADGSVYSRVPEGTGLFSSQKYTYLGADKALTKQGGEYSLDYMLVGEGNGNWNIEEVQESNHYSSSNSQYSYYDRYYAMHGYNSSNYEDCGKFVAFKHKSSSDDGKPTYNVKCYTDDIWYDSSWNDRDNEYNKYYILEESDETDYDLYEEVSYEKYEGNAKILKDHVGPWGYLDTTLPQTIRVGSVVYSRETVSEDKTNKPSGYNSATVLYDQLDGGYHRTYKYDDDYFYYYYHYNKKYYYDVYKYTCDVTETKYYTFKYTNSPSKTAGNDYYTVIFEYDENGNGRYVADESISKSSYERADYGMTYETVAGTEAFFGWKNVGAGNGSYNKITGIYTIPQEVGTYKRLYGSKETVKLGDYTRTELTTPEIIVERDSENNSTGLIGNRDYQRYILVAEKATRHYYSYSIVSTPGTGTHKWVGFSYAENSTKNPADFPGIAGKGLVNLSQSVYEDWEAKRESSDTAWTDLTNEIPDKINQDYYFGFSGSWTSYDLFKKYGIGLAYVDEDFAKGEDSNDYEFLGWYKDKYGVNKFVESEGIKEDTTLYAKWLTKYSTESHASTLNVTFDPNMPSAAVTKYTNEAIEKYKDTKLQQYVDQRLETLANELKDAGKTDEEIAQAKTELLQSEEFATEKTEYRNNIQLKETDDPDKYIEEVANYIKNYIAAQIQNVPATVTDIAIGERIGEPESIPMLDDYVFTGWYTKASCEDDELYDFSTNLAHDAVLYAGWRTLSSKRYKFHLQKNTEYLGLINTVFNVTMNSDTLSGIAENCRYKVDPSSEDYAVKNFVVAQPTDPTCKDNFGNNYLFGGWYLNPGCTVKFDFNANIPEGMTDANPGTEEAPDPEIDIILYAKWVSSTNRPQYTVSFNTNEPSGTSQKCDAIKSVKKPFGEGFTAGQLPIPELEGNVASKIANYNIKVITVTPKDLAIADNLKLIDRANLIILNETKDADLAELFVKFRNKELFSKAETAYRPAAEGMSATSFVQNDLGWDALVCILSRITGYKDEGGEIKAVDTCPVIYDYNIYTNSLANSGKNINLNLKLNGETVSKNNLASSNVNAYKLYLLTQVSSPITLFNAYMRGDKSSSKGRISSSTAGKAAFLNTDANNISSVTDEKALYWNPYTLVPANIIDKDDWKTKTEEEALKLVSFTKDITVTKSTENNRLFIYNEDDSFLKLFNTYINSSADNDAMKEVMGDRVLNYRTADYVYYMLHSSLEYDVFDKELRILEIEPGSYSKSSEFWFWYICHYVPNYTGKTTATSMSTTEFVCKIDDLNSKYDVIYIGVNPQGMKTDWMPSYSKVISNTADDFNAVSVQYTVPGTNTKRNGKKAYISNSTQIPFAYYRVDEVTTTSESFDIISESGLSASQIQYYKDRGYSEVVFAQPIILSNSGTLQINWDANLNNQLNSLGLTLKVSVDTQGTYQDSSFRYYVGDQTRDHYKYIKDTNVGSSLKITDQKNNTYAWVWRENRNTSDWWMRIQQWQTSYVMGHTAYGDFVDGDIYLQNLLVKRTVTTNTTEVLTPCTANSSVSEHYIIYDDSVIADQTITGKYIYSHIGKEVSGGSNRRGIFSSTKIDANGFRDVNGSSDDDINTFTYSGNDLTYAKYKAIAEFINAGYPVVLSRTMFAVDNTGKEVVDKYQIDSASWLYKLCKELVETDNTYHWFKENDTSKSELFKAALKNKTFRLMVNSKPVQYVDTTLDEYEDYPDSKVYVNGANIENTTFEYEILVDSKASGYFQIDMYIDANADGKYDESDEHLDSIEITNLETGHSVRYDRLKAGVRYKISRRIQEYTGVIPWKLQITALKQNATGSWVKTSVRDEETGMSAIKVENKTELYVLQIYSTGEDTNWRVNTVYFPTDEDIAIAKSKNSGKAIDEVSDSDKATYFKKSGVPLYNIIYNRTYAGDNGRTRDTAYSNAGWFHYYTYMLKEFNVHFVRMTVSQLDTLAAKSAEDRKKAENKIGDYYDEAGASHPVTWDMINMMIIGYADCYNDISNAASLKMIYDFISEGKTCLFTHDTTSFVTMPTGQGFDTSKDTYWGYGINRYFRTIVGTDRYGVVDNRGILQNIKSEFVEAGLPQNGENVDLSKIDISNAANYSLPYDLMFKTGKTQAVDLANLLYKTKASSKVEKLRDKTTDITAYDRVLNQGMTNAAVPGGNNLTTKATKTNDGQIVNYPYSIGENANGEITVSSTHPQYWQINMESDDIVIWYSLYNSGNNYLNIKNDGINNYYIYNKGNITYSGVGHQGDLSDSERRLFVNTMIAAYSATVQPTKPVITNRDKSNSDSNTDYLYVDYDGSIKSGQEGSKIPIGNDVLRYYYDGTVYDGSRPEGTPTYYAKRVTFTLQNFSIILNKRMTVHYYPVVYDETTGTRVVLYNCPLKLKTYNLATHNQAVETKDKFTYSKFAQGADAKAAKENYDSVTVNNSTDDVSYMVESLEEYYVDIPISDNYYKDVLGLESTYTYHYYDTATGTKELRDISNTQFALDEKSTFEVEIQVAMRWGRVEANNAPKVGTRGVVFMRRGMFTLD